MNTSSPKLSITVRPYEPEDAQFVLSLAPRLVIGIPSWRDPARMLLTVQNWLSEDIKNHGATGQLLIAEDDQKQRLGLVNVTHEQHFTGLPHATIGELAVSAEHEGSGVGRELVRACERWTRAQGYTILSLSTGAANHRARGFYQRIGFLEEDVKLVKIL